MTIISAIALKTTEFQDGQAAGSITPSDVRDLIDSAFGAASTQQSGTTYTLALADAGTVVETTGAGTGTPARVTITVPPNSSVAFPVGTVIQFCQDGTGQILLAAGAGVTLRTSTATLTTRAQYSEISIRQRAANEWVVRGDLS